MSEQHFSCQDFDWAILTLTFLKHSKIAFAVCLGSLYCWKMSLHSSFNLLLSFAASNKFFFRIASIHLPINSDQLSSSTLPASLCLHHVSQLALLVQYQCPVLHEDQNVRFWSHLTKTLFFPCFLCLLHCLSQISKVFACCHCFLSTTLLYRQFIE